MANDPHVFLDIYTLNQNTNDKLNIPTIRLQVL